MLSLVRKLGMPYATKTKCTKIVYETFNVHEISGGFSSKTLNRDSALASTKTIEQLRRPKATKGGDLSNNCPANLSHIPRGDVAWIALARLFSPSCCACVRVTCAHTHQGWRRKPSVRGRRPIDAKEYCFSLFGEYHAHAHLTLNAKEVDGEKNENGIASEPAIPAIFQQPAYFAIVVVLYSKS